MTSPPRIGNAFSLSLVKNFQISLWNPNAPNPMQVVLIVS
jgi:hypothetical protein